MPDRLVSEDVKDVLISLFGYGLMDYLNKTPDLDRLTSIIF